MYAIFVLAKHFKVLESFELFKADNLTLFLICYLAIMSLVETILKAKEHFLQA